MKMAGKLYILYTAIFTAVYFISLHILYILLDKTSHNPTYWDSGLSDTMSIAIISLIFGAISPIIYLILSKE